MVVKTANREGIRMKIDTDKGHGYTPCSRRRNPGWGVNGQTKLLYKVTGANRALRGLFGNRRRLSSSTGSQCPKHKSSLRPIRLPKFRSRFRAFGRSQIIHTPSSLGLRMAKALASDLAACGHTVV